MRTSVLKNTILFAAISVLHISPAHSAQTVRIAIVLDGPVKREVLRSAQIKKEIKNLISGEFDIVFPQDKMLHGNWKVDRIKEVLQQLLDDPEVDLIIANGLLSSHQAAQFESLSKPVIAPVIVDRILQELPYRNGVSGRHNYVYISDNRTVAQDLRQFHQLLPFRHLAIIVDPLFLDALPQLKGVTHSIQRELGFELTFLPVADSLVDGLAGLPDEVEAVYVPPLLRFSKTELEELARGLIERRLPGFSLLGGDELEMGLLATLSGRDIDTTRYARRIALYVQSILLGADAAGLKVELEQPQKLAINMRTARAIGFSPKWQFLEAADLLYEEESDERPPVSIVDAIKQALEKNLSLQIDKLDLALAKTEVSNARAPLLPQLNFSAGVTQIDPEQAGVAQAQRSSDADLSASQLIYSESASSGYRVARLLEQMENAALRANTLDVISASATAYLQLLLADSAAKVRRSNLDVTETNLELAKSRLKIGQTGRAEVLRWQSQLATDRRSLYSARSARDQAMTELKRQLHLPLAEVIAVSDAGIAEVLTNIDSERFQRFFDDPASFAVFTEFEAGRAIRNAPELEQIHHIIAANQRRLQAAERTYYLPDVTLNAQYRGNIERGGRRGNDLHDDEWSLGVQASLPLYAGGGRRAEVARANNALIQSRYQLQNIREQVEARIRTALQQAGGSYPAIRLSEDAAAAAAGNLALVIDAYSKGAVSITDLIDAQDAALAANLSAVEAQYQFMLDWIEIQRAVADFDLLLSADGFDRWYRVLDEYYKTRR